MITIQIFDNSDLIKKLKKTIGEQEKRIDSMTKKLENYKEMLNFI